MTPQEQARRAELLSLGLSEAEIDAVMGVSGAPRPPSVPSPSAVAGGTVLSQPPTTPGSPGGLVSGPFGTSLAGNRAEQGASLLQQLLDNTNTTTIGGSRDPNVLISDAQAVQQNLQRSNFDFRPYTWSAWSSKNGFDHTSESGRRRLMAQFLNNVIPFVASKTGQDAEQLKSEFIVKRPELNPYINDTRGIVGQRVDFIDTLRSQGYPVSNEEASHFLRFGSFEKPKTELEQLRIRKARADALGAEARNKASANKNQNGSSLTVKQVQAQIGDIDTVFREINEVALMFGTNFALDNPSDNRSGVTSVVPLTGPLGALEGPINFGGSERLDLARIVEGIKGKIAFDKLKELRETSRNGSSGLGQVTEKEIGLLEKSLGALDTDMREDQFIKQMKKIHTHYTRLRTALENEQSLLTGEQPPSSVTNTDQGFNDF